MQNVFLGIDIGSTNLKACLFLDPHAIKSFVVPHEGNLERAMSVLMAQILPQTRGRAIQALVTGTEGRNRIRLPKIIAPVAIEQALKVLGLKPRAVVSMGGEDLVAYVTDARGRIVSTYAGNKCASGTGEFFRQQLGRMDVSLDDLVAVAQGATLQKLSSRCSVFMKSDCTHRLNKGQATKGDIALSLSKVMADKVVEFLTKAKVYEGQVVLVGGATQNQYLVDFVVQANPDITHIVPKQAMFFEAFGAACLAEAQGGFFPEDIDLVSREHVGFEKLPLLSDATDQVTYARSVRGTYDPKARYILGVDGGSTTTKAALIKFDTLEIVAEHYGRTHGNPVEALKLCLSNIATQLDHANPDIVLVATTGSSRELLGTFLETKAVYNEIIAHTVGTTYFEPGVDTLFEIGGQDAKYVFVNQCVPLDYAMNEACSAGTGSFLEESAHGDLCINQAADIGPIALLADAPLKFGEHCSAFINSDIRKAIQQGASRENIVAGLIYSVVTNYLNRVVGNRPMGGCIVLQGGVAKNPAVPLAFATVTEKPILVPPDPELMGCFGVARVAKQKCLEGLLHKERFSLEQLVAKEITHGKHFVCKACENRCEIQHLHVGGRAYPFGGRCSLYTNVRVKRVLEKQSAKDFTALRSQMLFDVFEPTQPDCSAREKDSEPGRPSNGLLVGVPTAFSVHSLWPLYAGFFKALGVSVQRSTEISSLGISKQESNYCFPMEIAHGAIQNLLDQRVDYLFLPHFRDMPSMEKDVPACLCPLTQGLPYVAKHAFSLEEKQILKPLVSLKDGFQGAKASFESMAIQLGFTRKQGRAAYAYGTQQQERFFESYRQLGENVLRDIEAHPDKTYVALLGRPYNAFTKDANMGIPRKFVSRGLDVIPFDMIYDPAAETLPNNYWFFGQENLKALRRIRDIPNLFVTWISNFSCAPDSFLLHYVQEIMGHKPYLVLEIDSHTADAGLDTRIEAFLDIVESYQRHAQKREAKKSSRRYSITLKKEYCDVVDTETHERFDIRDPRVTLVWPSMGDLAVQALQRASIKRGIQAVHLPLPDVHSTALARRVASGKECVPALLVLGSILKFFAEDAVKKDNQIYVVFVPSTVGPCRTGQYHVLYDRVFDKLGLENVVQLVGTSDNSYREMGATFNQDVWWGLCLSDYFADARLGIRLLAKDVEQGLDVFDKAWRHVLQGFQKGGKALTRALGRASKMLSGVRKRRTLEELRKVLVVGEIYVRRDNFSVTELCDFLIERDIFPKVTNLTEWFHFTDYARDFARKEEFHSKGVLKGLASCGLKSMIGDMVEVRWKHFVENKIRKALFSTGLVPDSPHGMHHIMEQGRKEFVEPTLESEAAVSPAVAAEAMNQDYSGVAVIAPFGCLIGRVSEGVYAPWAKSKGYPVIALENDGNLYPPNVISRLEVFAHNVQAFDQDDVPIQHQVDAQRAIVSQICMPLVEKTGKQQPQTEAWQVDQKSEPTTKAPGSQADKPH